MLRTYTASLALMLVGTLTTTIYLMASGAKVVHQWADDETNWELVQTKVYTITRAQFFALVEGHQAQLLTLIGLLVFVLAVDLAMACVLQASVSRHGRLYQAPDPQLEMEPLNGKGKRPRRRDHRV